MTQFKPNALQGRIFANIEKRNIEGKPVMPLTTRIWKARQSTSNLVSYPIYREFLELKRKEWNDYHRQVTPWEVERYLTMH